MVNYIDWFKRYSKQERGERKGEKPLPLPLQKKEALRTAHRAQLSPAKQDRKGRRAGEENCTVSTARSGEEGRWRG